MPRVQNMGSCTDFRDSVNPKAFHVVECKYDPMGSRPGFHHTCSFVFIRFPKGALRPTRLLAYIIPSSWPLSSRLKKQQISKFRFLAL